jgi:hypothetical protein
MTFPDAFGSRRWAKRTFQILVSLAALSAFLQPVLAGAYLGGHFGALDLHSVNGTIANALALLMTVAAILVRRPGRGAWWPAAVSGGLFLAEALQIVFGYTRSVSLHIPLGSAIIAAFVVLLVRVWRPASVAPSAAPAETAEPVGVR